MQTAQFEVVLVHTVPSHVPQYILVCQQVRWSPMGCPNAFVAMNP